MAAIAQTIAIVDKSGKVVSTSKQLKNVFKEAKFAYLERRAEIAGERKAKEERELRKAIKAMSVADEERSEVSRTRSHTRSHRQRDHSRRDPELLSRPSTDRHQSGRSVRSDYSGTSIPGSPDSHHSPSRSPLSRDVASNHRSPTVEHEFDDYFPSQTGRSTPVSPLVNPPGVSDELICRRTDLELELAPAKPPRPGSLLRSKTSPTQDNIDLDLAYGEFHPESISPTSPSLSRAMTFQDKQLTQQKDKEELSSLVLKCKMLIDEANCAQHSVKAVMAHLQTNPDAMAAVALTLAEISNVASKLGPGVLMTLKAGAPTVFALLAAPEFLIAVGVGVGLTVVMFGGYKIMKKIKAAREGGSSEDVSRLETPGSMDEMIDVEELSRIEHWRRGIADTQFDDGASEVGSVATSVEGEFITPIAARSMGHLPLPSRKKEKEKEKGKEGEKKRRRRRHGSEAGSEKSQGSKASSSKLGDKETREKALIKIKKPSPLRRMFKGEGSSVAS